MSPEQMRGEPTTARSDVYSLGLVLYEAATGRRPGTAISLAQVPSNLHDVISRSTAADPRERYASGREMKAALASEREQPRRNLVSRLWLPLGVFTTLTASLFAFLLSRPATAPSYYSAVPLTSEAGAQLCPSFAPDGDSVAFSWDGEGQDNFDIYVK